MLFNSYIFICIFLPIALIGWYTLNHFKLYRTAGLFLSGMSLWFYAYFNLSYLAIILSSIVINYLISIIVKYLKKENVKKLIMVFSIFINLGILFYFKYFDFFITNVNAISGKDFALKGILLPLGISFFTFQQLSFVVDRCLGKAEHYNFIDYMTFVTFFPQLIAGPIVLYDEMMPQFMNLENRKPKAENFEKGIKMFIIGLGKKVLLADILALPVNYAFSYPEGLDSLSAIAVMLLYTFEIYFDFSGYCDMAIGLGSMFNIELPINFNSPYKSTTVKEMWNRWHITLSRFFTTYVYIPLGGSRKGFPRMLLNVLIVFTLSGLWHGAAWTYVAWGVMNGILVIWDNLCIVGVKGTNYKKECKVYIPKWLGWILTFGFFVLSLCFFRSSSIPEAINLIKTIFSFKYNGSIFLIGEKLSTAEFYVFDEAVRMVSSSGVAYLHIVFMVLMLMVCFFIISKPNSVELSKNDEHPVRTAILLAIVLIWSFISLSQVSTFLYFNF